MPCRANHAKSKDQGLHEIQHFLRKYFQIKGQTLLAQIKAVIVNQH